MDYKEVQSRLEAAQKLLDASTTNKEKFDSLVKLVKGLNPNLDKKLDGLAKAFTHFDRLNQGEIAEITLDSLPIFTEKDKERKKALLLLIRFWKDLKSEVARVKTEIAQTPTNQLNTSVLGKLMTFAKGPLGIVTLIAVGLVALNLTSVDITIKNRGCDTIHPVSVIPFPIAGIKLPNTDIPDGGQAQGTLLPVTVTLDNSQPGKLLLRLYGISYSFNYDAGNVSFTLDDTPITGSLNTFNLGNQPAHELVISCNE